MPDIFELFPEISDRLYIPQKGDSIKIDEIQIDFIYTYHKELTNNLMNDSSLVFKVITPNTSVLFLGDLGPEGGDYLYWESRDKLKADIVQMAHHGHMNVSMEIYAAIAPKICMWNARDWLYNEPEVPAYLSNFERAVKTGRTRMYGTAVTRKWMDSLGVKTHYVTKDGTNKIIL